MADFSDALTDAHGAMIAAQPVFFVSTAADGAQINLSPKGYDCFRVLSPTRVAYLDRVDSENETNAHPPANVRFTLFFCKCHQLAQNLRILCREEPVVPWDRGW